jgi:hypothetical protein
MKQSHKKAKRQPSKRSPRPASSSVAIDGSFGGGLIAFCLMTLPAIPISMAPITFDMLGDCTANAAIASCMTPTMAITFGVASHRFGRHGNSGSRSAKRTSRATPCPLSRADSEPIIKRLCAASMRAVARSSPRAWNFFCV